MRDGEQRRSQAVAPATDNSLDRKRELPPKRTEEQEKRSSGIERWVEETKANQERKASQINNVNSLEKDSLVQEIMGLSAYQSVPVSKVNGISAGDPLKQKFTEVNSASLNFYQSNPSTTDLNRKNKLEKK